MRYVEFKSLILDELREHADGFTWREPKERLDLPYRTPCPEWVKWMEKEDGLTRVRVKERGRAFVWKVM